MISELIIDCLLVEVFTFLSPDYLNSHGVVPQNQPVLHLSLEGGSQFGDEVHEAGDEAGVELVLNVEQPPLEPVVSGQAGADSHELGGLGRTGQDLLQHLATFEVKENQKYIIILDIQRYRPGSHSVMMVPRT